MGFWPSGQESDCVSAWVLKK